LVLAVEVESIEESLWTKRLSSLVPEQTVGCRIQRLHGRNRIYDRNTGGILCSRLLRLMPFAPAGVI
jgi:hypothetical protein